MARARWPQRQPAAQVLLDLEDAQTYIAGYIRKIIFFGIGHAISVWIKRPGCAAVASAGGTG